MVLPTLVTPSKGDCYLQAVRGGWYSRPLSLA
jgi:hypothetical protein